MSARQSLHQQSPQSFRDRACDATEALGVLQLDLSTSNTADMWNCLLCHGRFLAWVAGLSSSYSNRARGFRHSPERLQPFQVSGSEAEDAAPWQQDSVLEARRPQ